MNSNSKKILYLVTEDWYFYSHRLSLACEAKDAGYNVVVVTNVNEYGDEIRKNGFELVNLDLERKSWHPLGFIRKIIRLIKIYSRQKPDIVHHISLKPVILGSIASVFSKVPHVINTLTGLGFVFTSRNFATRIVKIFFVEPALNLLFNRSNTWTIIQNIDDKKLLIALGILKTDRSVLIKGSGVDLNKFRAFPEMNYRPVVMLASRMLIDKGVREYILSAKQLIKERVDADFVLVGDIDPGNPSSVDENDIKEWCEEGTIQWWGYKSDMSNTLAKAHIICLPSYREGLPKVLLEAAATGRPIVATDVPGCREIVRNGENGILVPAMDPSALAQALKCLIEDKSLREKMGKEGRMIVEQEFSNEIINASTLQLYHEVIDNA